MSTAIGHGLADPKRRGKPVSYANKGRRVSCPMGVGIIRGLKNSGWFYLLGVGELNSDIRQPPYRKGIRLIFRNQKGGPSVAAGDLWEGGSLKGEGSNPFLLGFPLFGGHQSKNAALNRR